MILRGVLASTAAAAFAATPLAAQAAPREDAPVAGEQLGGSPWITIAVVFAVLAGLLLIVGNSDGPEGTANPLSP